MLTAKSIKAWYLVHKWTSLVCTIFMLMLCITGLPLIFYHEIDHALDRHPEVAPMPEGTPLVSLDRIVEAGRALHPDLGVRFMSFDDEEPIVYLSMTPDAERDKYTLESFDARSGAHIKAPPFDEGFMWIIFKLHADLFAGLPGMLFLGLMGLLFVASLVSGVVVYGPFMRKLDFGTLRTRRSARVKWLDYHNLVGIVTLAWAFVVGGTGVINTLSTPILMLWQQDQLAEMVAAYDDKAPLAPAQFVSIDTALHSVREALPDTRVRFVAYPGTDFSSRHHYAVFLEGNTPLTAKLLKPALVDAETGELTASRSLPWYVAALLLSQPLHFGDYGGMPMKIIWALLDIATIVVLGSGVYLWLGKRRSSIEVRLAELERGAEPAGA